MSTPTSFPQIIKMWEQLGKPNNERLQWLLASGLFDDLGAAAGPHLSDVDRSAFKALLAPPPKDIKWTPVSEYLTKLHSWNERFDLGLPAAQINSLVLPDHAGPHQPTGISLTLGKGLLHDRAVVQRIIAYEMAMIRHPYTDYIGRNGWSVAYYPGCEPVESREPELAPALLDIGRFWDPKNGVTIPGVRKQLIAGGEPLPTLEVDWLMALNPQVLAAIDYKVVPGFIAPGLVVGSGGAPGFRRGGDGAYADVCWDGLAWYDVSVVAFRGC